MTYQHGHMGMKLAAKQRVLTTSGRITGPFPAWTKATGRLAKRIDVWLHAEYVAEAQFVGDDYALILADAADPKRLSGADRDQFESYLFDPAWAAFKTSRAVTA